MQPLPATRSCFVCGRQNPIGLNLRIETDGLRVQAKFHPAASHVGFQNTVHGGIIAAVLDEVMVWACGVNTKRFAYCAEFTVRFVQPLRPGTDALAVGELVSNRREKIFEARAELKDSANALLAMATGKYLPIPQTDAKRMFEDFEEGIEKILGPVM